MAGIADAVRAGGREINDHDGSGDYRSRYRCGRRIACQAQWRVVLKYNGYSLYPRRTNGGIGDSVANGHPVTQRSLSCNDRAGPGNLHRTIGGVSA
jgi:hypothetical protein